ncbi:MAG: alpha/beta hydrolase [Burkholderiaceae bacterium]|nr:alpha/beta hydrolase [Burkholderiaceae bacterium]
MSTRFVERIAVEIDGEGDAVLLIHGLGGSSNVWTPLAPALSRLRSIRFDLPGSARSARVEGPLSIERFAQAALRVAAAAGAERAHVVAHSLGTIVAFHLAVAEPKFVRSLALFGPLVAPAEPARAAIRARAAKARDEGEAGMQEIADALVQGATASETKAKRPVAVALVRELLMRQSPDGYARTCEALAEAQPADVTRIQCPTLLVTGDEDAVAPPQEVRRIAGLIAGSQVEILRGCGHWTTVEKPEECGALLQQFFARRMS